MTVNPREVAAMRTAIALSALGLGTTSPNPPVGCVVLDAAGSVVGTGFHRRKGEPHAETHALAMSAGRATGGTAVVTLEPCNHIGVTPACRQALLDAKIARVVIAVLDPTSRGEGGAAALRHAGVQVETGLLHDEALLVLGPWLAATRRRRPYVSWAYAVTADTGQPAPFDAMPLRRSADAALHHGQIEEGVNGAHGPGTMHLPTSPVDLTDVDATLRGLFNSGVRTLLALDDTSDARALFAADAVDAIVIDVIRDGSDRSRARDGWQLPGGYHLDSITTTRSGVRVRATRTDPTPA